MSRKTRRWRGALVAASAAALLMMLASLPTTSAGFTDTTTSTGNTLLAGSVQPPSNLQLTAGCVATPAITFRSSSTTRGQGSTITLARPSGTVAGDALVAHLVLRDDVALTAPTGWTLIHRSTTGPYSAVYHKTAGSGEPASYSWTGSSVRYAAGLGAWSNVSTVTAIHARSGAGGSGSSIVAPSITTTRADTMLVAFWSIRNDGGVTVPASMTERWDIASNESGATGHQVQSSMATEPMAVAGASGTRTASAAASESNVGQMIALQKPAIAKIDVTWTATPSTFATGYTLQRWLGGVQQTNDSIIPRTSTSVSHAPLEAGQTYQYRLRAYHQSWQSSEVTQSVTTGSC